MWWLDQCWGGKTVDLYVKRSDLRVSRVEDLLATNACRGHSVGWNHSRKKRLTRRLDRCPMGNRASKALKAAALIVLETYLGPPTEVRLYSSACENSEVKIQALRSSHHSSK